MHSNKFRGSIRSRMVAIYLLVTTVALFAINFMISGLVESFLVTQRTERQLEETMRLALELTQKLDAADAEELYALILERAQTMGGRILVLDQDAVVRADSTSFYNGYQMPYREVRDVLVAGKQSSYGFHRIDRVSDGDGGIWPRADQMVWAVYYAAPITSGGAYAGAVLFSTLLQDVEDSVTDIITKITIAFAAVALIMAVLSFAMSSVVTKPILELTNAIRRMGRQGRGVRVEVKGSDETAELGRAFNRMSEQIEAHDRVRDEFVSNASHELKTPLATMKLLSESILYEETPDPALMKEFFQDVNHEVDRLTRVITDLLRLVQIDETESEMEPVPVRLDEVVRRVLDRLRPLAEQKGISLSGTLQEATVSGEAMRLEQVATNLIENAIKYTDAGSVAVRVSVDGTEALFAVADTGIGIPEEAQPHLFERFYRVDKARSRGTGGTGLGLAIVERVIALHGGYIEVQSKLGEGSTFTVHLPLQKPDAEKGEAE
ncbi:MAG: ATP-binding protein [bacterium]|nr:ATP-binding protein [bacterium]